MEKYKSAYPHIIAILIFIILGSIYFAPQFRGYSLNQSDIKNFQGMSKEISDFRQMEKKEPLWTNSMFGGMPAYQIAMGNTNLLFTMENFIFFKIFKGQLGIILLAMVSFYIMLLCFEVNPWLCIFSSIAFGLSSVNILYLAGGHVTKVHAIALIPGIIGSMVYAYRKNIIVGGLLLSIFVCLHITANHIQETYYLLFLIAFILIVELYNFYKESRLPDFFKRSAFLALAVVIGVLPTMSNLLVTNEYSKYTTRGKSDLTVAVAPNADQSDAQGLNRDYIKQYSLGYGEIWSLAVPDIKGGASGYLGNMEDKMSSVTPEFRENIAGFNSYWGEQYFTGGAFYFGATIFLLFILGAVFIKDRIKWAFIAGSILAVFLAWKFSSVLDLFIDYIPLFNKFRDTKMILIIAQVAFPLLGVLFVKEMVNNELDKKKLNYTLLITIGIFFLFYIMPSVWFSFFSSSELNMFDRYIRNNPGAVQQIDLFKEEIQKIRISIFKEDMLRAIIFMVLVGLLVILFTRKVLKQTYFVVFVSILVVIDIWSVDKRYLNNKKQDGVYEHWVRVQEKSNPFQASVADLKILEQEMAKDTTLSLKISNNLSLLKIDENESQLNNQKEQEKVKFSTLNFATDYRVLYLPDPFNNSQISYFHKSVGGYFGAKLKRYQELIDFRISKECQYLSDAIKRQNWASVDSVLKFQSTVLNMLNTRYLIFNPEAPPIYNRYVCGEAWFVREVKVVKNADEEILSLDSIHPNITAVVDRKFEDQLKQVHNDSSATIRLIKYMPNHLSYKTNCKKEQVAVFSEIYYKDGWDAYVDGKPAPYFRANYILRAMNIPAGEHKIEFKFEPKTYYLSQKISYAGTILMVLFILGTLGFEIRKKMKS
jgi:hypothetical protein